MKTSWITFIGWREIQYALTATWAALSCGHTCRQRHVRVAVPAETVNKTATTPALCHPNQFELLVSTTNTGLFGKYRSDVHAEANAISHFAKHGHLGMQQKGGVQVTTCYVTRAPCSNCYSLIASAGIRRIVCPQNYTSKRVELSAKHLNIEWVVVRDEAATRNARDQDALRFEDKSRIEAMRLARKEMKKQKRAEKKKARVFK